MTQPFKLHHGDCIDVMRAMPDNSVDSVVTDPPYELGFMGKKWDATGVANDPVMWSEVLRVLKPGGHLLAFSGSRTYHRMTCAIEDAGFEIRDQIMWVYGCLDEQTEVATSNGVMPYHKAKIGDTVLCYNAENKEYSYQPILEIVEYDYDDTAYRLIGDFGEQVVSRNHRVIVEQGGKESFYYAETLGNEASVPVLESLHELQQAIHDAQQDASCKKQVVQQRVCECLGSSEELGRKTIGEAQREADNLRGLQGNSLEAELLAEESQGADVQLCVQREIARSGMGEACTQGTKELEAGVGSSIETTDDWVNKSSMERRSNVSQSQGCVCKPTDKVCSMSCGVHQYGTQGRLCDGASLNCCSTHGTTADTSGISSSHEPRCDGQQTGQSDDVRYERTAQGIRAWKGHKSTLVRVEPFRYRGKVWCLRVPTGAFVAVRNGVAFPTGNSGFPKSLDVSKAIDKAAGAERGTAYIAHGDNQVFGNGKEKAAGVDRTPGAVLSEPAVTEAAQQWQGWGTALKPAHEPICVARKPLVGTVAANVLAFGTGAINIDGCRVNSGPVEIHTRTENVTQASSMANVSTGSTGTGQFYTGRWPANLIHDGSAEVVALFPDSNGSGGARTLTRSAKDADNGWGMNSVQSDSAALRDAGTGSAARFFYCAKASRADRNEGLLNGKTPAVSNGATMRNKEDANWSTRNGNSHPTVKPTELMAYLCRLVTPPNGVVLDPFMGSGSTGKAAIREGFTFIGIEREQEYIDIARARIEHACRVENDLQVQQNMELF